MIREKKSAEPALLKCPLCEGRGELPEQEMLDRLREKDLCRKIASYLDVVEGEAKASASEPPDGPRLKDSKFNSEVNTWNLTHFLWRRSPKE